MARIFADNPNAAMPADHSALLTDRFDARSNLHNFPSIRDRPRLDESSRWLLVSIGDSTPGEVVWGQFHLNPVARKNSDVMHSHLAGDVSKDFVSVLQLHSKHCVWQWLNHGSLKNNGVFL